LIPTTILLAFWLFSLLVVIVFLVSSLKAFRKFNSLNLNAQTRIARIDYYMLLIRSFPKEELNVLSGLTDKEIEYFDAIRDTDLLKKETRQRIRRPLDG
jgi:hypothetical protein